MSLKCVHRFSIHPRFFPMRQSEHTVTEMRECQLAPDPLARQLRIACLLPSSTSITQVVAKSQDNSTSAPRASPSRYLRQSQGIHKAMFSQHPADGITQGELHPESEIASNNQSGHGHGAAARLFGDLFAKSVYFFFSVRHPVIHTLRPRHTPRRISTRASLLVFAKRVI